VFPSSRAELTTQILERDRELYRPAISVDATSEMNRFATASGLLSHPVPYEQVVATQFRTVWQSDTFVFRTSVDQCDCGEDIAAGETLPFDTNGDSQFDDTSKRQPRAVATIASLSTITSSFLFLPNIILENKRGQPFRPAPLPILIRCGQNYLTTYLITYIAILPINNRTMITTSTKPKPPLG